MQKGPSLIDSNGIASLEGKLRLAGGVSSAGSSAISSYEKNDLSSAQEDFESALTATVCMKINNYTFSGSHIEAVNLN